MHYIRKLRSSQSSGGLHVTLQLRNRQEGVSTEMFTEAPQLGYSAGSRFSLRNRHILGTGVWHVPDEYFKYTDTFFKAMFVYNLGL